MQKKVSAAVRAFGRAHKAGLALLGGGMAALGVFCLVLPAVKTKKGDAPAKEVRSK